jgi:hypothetical protein
MAAAAFEEIADLLQRYLDGLHQSDAEALLHVFHPDAVYACATAEPLVRLSMGEYLPIVAARPSPASRGEVRRDEILAIELAGPNTAFAKVRCAIAPKRFTDFLTIVRVPEGWRIMAKIFHYELEHES